MQVASRVMEVWPDFVTLIKESLLRCPSKRLQSNVLKHHTEASIMIKFSIFKEIARMLMEFLKTFQTVAPMVPFMNDCLEKLLRRLLNFLSGGRM